MKILIVHNKYRRRGGEDVVAEAEAALLRRHGHEVESYIRRNDSIDDIGPPQLLQQTFWSSQTVRDLERYIRDFDPDILHVHNTFPLVSPSLFWAAARNALPVVQTLHNFRLICPQAMFLRSNAVCEDCLGGTPWRGALRGCYRGSVLQSTVLTSMLAVHRTLGTYRNKVTRYIALNRFCEQKFIQGGLPAERIMIKPHFVDLPAPPEQPRSGALFVGRLSPEKGIRVLRDAIDALPWLSVKVIGDGPELSLLAEHARVEYLGELDSQGVIAAMCSAAYLIMPSIWYETFGMVILEAFACGLPVIASRHGAMEELIDDGKTGLLAEPGSVEDLASKITWANTHPEEMLQMGRNAREEYQSRYTPEENYLQLMRIYDDALAEASATELSRNFVP